VIIFHIAEKSRWEAARLAGAYAQSTYGRTLEQEGFIHAAREDQWQGVRQRYYADVTEPLVLLAIDTDQLTSPWREDQVGHERYPHIYGPLNPSAVVSAVPLERAPATAAPAHDRAPQQSFLSLFVNEVAFRIAWAVVAMVVGALLGLLAIALLGDGWGLLGVAAGLVLVFLAGRPIAQRRDERLARHD
jgi:uncharacterized protein (DUF952 family)